MCINGTSAVSNVPTPKNSLIIGKAGYIITGFLQKTFFLSEKLCWWKKIEMLFLMLFFLSLSIVYLFNY